MTPGLFLKAAAVVLAAGSLSPASAKVEDMGMLAAPIANGYVDANPASWPSEFDTDLIPAAIVDFQPVEAFLDGVSFDPLVATAGLFFPQRRSPHHQILVAFQSLNLPSERRIRLKGNRNCSSGAANIIRCSFYDADLLLLSGEPSNINGNQSQPGQNPPVINVADHETSDMTSMAPLQSLIAMGCGNSAVA